MAGAVGNRILVGAPVYKRDWVLPYWFEALRQQEGDYSFGFTFYGAPDDGETRRVIEEEVDKFEDLWHFSYIEGAATNPNQVRREWNKDRYRYMTSMRNTLLRVAQAHQPDKYLSLDTDILLEDPTTLRRLDIATNSYADAASPLAFMSPDSDQAPSYMWWGGGGDNRAYRKRPRETYGHPFQADVIMAAKMMNKQTYSEASYYYHPQGEDLGWSLDCKEKNLRLYCLEDVYAVHIMSRPMLDRYLVDGDPRKSYLRVVN